LHRRGRPARNRIELSSDCAADFCFVAFPDTNRMRPRIKSEGMPCMKTFDPAGIITGFVAAAAGLAMLRNSVTDLPLKRRNHA
jgi:hypothetical protein